MVDPVSHRVEAYRRPEESEQFLGHLNQAFAIGEEQAVVDLVAGPQRPLLIVVGAPRSGTTVLMQWLQAWGEFAVPTNLLARFPGTPYLGGLVQRLLTDKRLDYLNELAIERSDGFQSQVGKTSGLLSPHEFFYFWRRFFPLERGRKMTAEEIGSCDSLGFVRSLGHLEQALNQPLAMKGILLQYDLALLADLLPTAIFLFSRRNESHNCESILESRRKVHGSELTWFSVMPPGAEMYLEESPIMQVAAQVALTNDHISKQLAESAPERTIIVQHEQFCLEPFVTAGKITEQCRQQGEAIVRVPSKNHLEQHQRVSPNRIAIEQALVEVRLRR